MKSRLLLIMLLQIGPALMITAAAAEKNALQPSSTAASGAASVTEEVVKGAPTFTEKAEQTNAVAVQGAYAYIGVGQRLVVIDASKPAAPRVLGNIRLPNLIQDLQVAGGYAYVAADDAGLQVIDIQNPAAPAIVGRYDTPGTAMGVQVVGNYAYVADGGNGLQVIDISNPAGPALVGTSKTSGWALKVCVSGNYALVAANEAGVEVFDISTASPNPVADLRFSTDVSDVFCRWPHAYVAAQGGGLRVIDISNPTPQEVGSNNDRYAGRVDVNGNIAFVAGEGAGVWAVDISNPRKPVVADKYRATRSANSVVAREDGGVYVADGAGGLLLIQRAPKALREQSRKLMPLTKASQ